jgi:hypothetical protein
MIYIPPLLFIAYCLWLARLQSRRVQPKPTRRLTYRYSCLISNGKEYDKKSF